MIIMIMIIILIIIIVVVIIIIILITIAGRQRLRGLLGVAVSPGGGRPGKEH